jgi:2-polyprenyl-3-methyl-5-hydroxy-6-metoxy-1,4-benzoquinol methylase
MMALVKEATHDRLIKTKILKNGTLRSEPGREPSGEGSVNDTSDGEIGECYHCGERGLPLYRDVPDWLFGAEGTWNFLQCPSCGLVWLSPIGDLHRQSQPYEEYYTHDLARPGRITLLRSLREKLINAILSSVFSYHSLAGNRGIGTLGSILGAIPALRDLAGARVMFLQDDSAKSLLDVGCGDGSFLRFMKDLNWDVTGIDVDPKAVELANQVPGVKVIEGTLEDAHFPDESFDAITLSHLIEHVVDPLALLKECRRILKKGGSLVLLTPNTRSFGHKFFGDRWRGLEPPRHLVLFNQETLLESLERARFHIRSRRTISRLAVTFWTHRRPSGDVKTIYGGRPSLWKGLTGVAFFFLEELGRFVDRSAGEEVLAIASR